MPRSDRRLLPRSLCRWFRGLAAGFRPAATTGQPRASVSAIGRKPRSRRLLETTNTDENAIAAPAIIGLSSPAAASGTAATL